MTTTRTETALIRELGRVDYEPTFAAMRAFTDARTTETRDELWIVEHPPVFTLGLAADRAICWRELTRSPWCRRTVAAKSRFTVPARW